MRVSEGYPRLHKLIECANRDGLSHAEAIEETLKRYEMLLKEVKNPSLSKDDKAELVRYYDDREAFDETFIEYPKVRQRITGNTTVSQRIKIYEEWYQR